MSIKDFLISGSYPIEKVKIKSGLCSKSFSGAKTRCPKKNLSCFFLSTSYIPKILTLLKSTLFIASKVKLLAGYKAIFFLNKFLKFLAM